MTHFVMTAIVPGNTAEEAASNATALIEPFCEDAENSYPKFWDWAVVGGRWRGDLRVLADADPADYSLEVGESSWTNTTTDADPLTADAARLRALDLDVPAEVSDAANARYDAFEAATSGWSVPDLPPGDAPREAFVAYWATPWATAVQKSGLLPFMSLAHDEFFVGTGGREVYVRTAVEVARFGTYGFVLTDEVLSEVLDWFPEAETGGERWIGRGRAGWFGISEEDSSLEAWLSATQAVLKVIREDAWLVTLDLHI